ncbi:DUF7260 family protein [Halorubrum laminariae]|uniref:DUF7260 domain-containing protein n=1 Tax=Halorubrum laminariae TaxID=1433523 RepID=A0ABD6C165_9EURY|nr:hypothetical protein [Halorubrum laminariae]
MSVNPGATGVFQVPSADPAAAECTTLSCEVGAAATEPGAVTAVVIVGLVAFLAFAYVRDATEACRRERSRVLAERDAFESFADRVSSLEPASAPSTTAVLDGPVAGVHSVDSTGGDVTLRRVLSAYRDTVMSLPHYEREYDETLPESLAAELGPDTATALASDRTLSTGAQSALVRRSQQAADARLSLADAIGSELDALGAAERELSGVDRRRRRLIEHLDGIDGNPADAAVDVWWRLDDLERECDALAGDRQTALDDPPLRPDAALDVESDRAFYEYLYGPSDGPNYPVLSQLAELGEQIRSDKDCVASRLAHGR